MHTVVGGRNAHQVPASPSSRPPQPAHSNLSAATEQLIQIELQKLQKENERLQREQEDINRRVNILSAHNVYRLS